MPTLKFQVRWSTKFQLQQKHNITKYNVAPGVGAARWKARYSSAMVVQVIDDYGQVKVTENKTNKPLPQAYCKVYAMTKTNGTEFYKDGYTDLRGRFDYASLSTGKLVMLFFYCCVVALIKWTMLN